MSETTELHLPDVGARVLAFAKAEKPTGLMARQLAVRCKAWWRANSRGMRSDETVGNAGVPAHLMEMKQSTRGRFTLWGLVLSCLRLKPRRCYLLVIPRYLSEHPIYQPPLSLPEQEPRNPSRTLRARPTRLVKTIVGR